MKTIITLSCFFGLLIGINLSIKAQTSLKPKVYLNDSTQVSVFKDSALVTCKTRVSLVLYATNCPSQRVYWRFYGSNYTEFYADTLAVQASGLVYVTCENDGTTPYSPNAPGTTVAVTFQTSPPKPTITTSQPFANKCVTDGITLTANCPGYNATALWQDNTQSLTYLATQEGIYTAKCVNSCGTGTAENSITLTNTFQNFKPSISADRTLVCEDEVAKLTLNNAASGIDSVYQRRWSNGFINSEINVNTPGAYFVSYTSPTCGTIYSDTVTIERGVMPLTIVANDTVICAGNNYQTIYLNIKWDSHNCENGTITWSTGSKNSFLNVNESGTYWATCTKSCDTSERSNEITINNAIIPETPVITSDTPETTILCNQSSATLTATGCDNTVQWYRKVDSNYNSPVGQGTSIQVYDKGEYYATCFKKSCAQSQPSNGVFINAYEPISYLSIIGNPYICNNANSTTLSVNGCSNGKLLWSTGETTQSITVTQTGTYSVTCSNPCDVTGKTKSIDVLKLDAAPIAAPVLSVDTTVICYDTRVTATVTGCENATYIYWSDGNITFLPENTRIIYSAGSYTASCQFGDCGLGNASNEVTITQQTIAKPTFVNPPESICDGDTITLKATGCQAGQYRWYAHPGNKTDSLIITQGGYYSVSCIEGCGQSPESYLYINTVYNADKPSIYISQSDTSTESCPPLLLTANCYNGEAHWSNGFIGRQLTLTDSGSYSAICVNDCSTSEPSDTIQIDNPTKPLPVRIYLYGFSNTNVCSKDTTKLTVDYGSCPNGIIRWSDGQTGRLIKTKTAGDYTAVCVTDCGTSDASNVISLTEELPSKPTIYSDFTSLCEVDSIRLYSYGCYNGNLIVWSNGQTGSIIYVKESGVYFAYCQNDCGLSEASNTINITDNVSSQIPPPIIYPVGSSLINGKVLICAEGSVTLQSNCSYPYQTKWTNVETNESFIGSSLVVFEPGSYYAKCISSCSESVISSTVSIELLPSISPSKITITANRTTIYTGAGLSDTNCSSTAQLKVTSCTNGILTWFRNYNDAIGNDTIINVNTVGRYYARCSNPCTGQSEESNSVTIEQEYISPVLLTFSSEYACDDQKTTLYGSCPEGVPNWSTGEQGDSIMVSSGSYWMTCQSPCDTSMIQKSIHISPIGVDVLNIKLVSDKKYICVENDSAKLTLLNCTSQVQWSTGETTPQINVYQPGVYSATCSNECGETEPFTTSIYPIELNQLIITTDQIAVKENEQTEIKIFTGSCDIGTIRWSNGDTTKRISVGAGTYTLTCMSSCNTQLASNEITIFNCSDYLTVPIITSDKTTLCNGEYAKITATGCNGNVHWSTGDVGSFIFVNKANTYTAFCRNYCGDSESSVGITLKATTDAPSPPVLTGENLACGATTATLNGTCDSGTITWNTGETTTMIQVTAGSYTATCQNSCGVSTESSIEVVNTAYQCMPITITRKKE